MRPLMKETLIWLLVFCCCFFFLGELKHSRILGNNENYLKYLRNWLKPVAQGKSLRWKCCWRASLDGWAASTFYSRCDNKGPTVTIIRVGGKYIFGGYTSLSWGKWFVFFQNWAYQHVKLSKELFEVELKSFVNLRNRTGEGRRPQALCDKRENNFVWNKFSPSFTFL